MATRAVTGTILYGDGSPWRGAAVQFRTTEDTYTLSPAQTLPLHSVEAVTDSNGQFTVSLIADLGVNYKVTLPDRSTFEITVPSGSPTTLEALRAATSGMPVPVDDLEDLLIALYGAPPAGRAALIIREGGTSKVAAATDLDFDASDFNVSESPTGRGNVSLAYGTSAGTPAEGNHNHDSTYSLLGHTHAQSDLGILEMMQASDYTGSNSTSAQKLFNVGSGGNGAFNVAANTSYQMEAWIYLRTTGTTSHSLSLLFALAGGASLTSIQYVGNVGISTTVAATATTAGFVGTAATAVLIAGAVATATHYFILLGGIVRVNAAGTFTPQFQFGTNAPGVAPVTGANSFFRLTPLGNGSVTTIGNIS